MENTFQDTQNPYSSPVNSAAIKKIFKSRETRDDFLTEYIHFGGDGNDETYLKWIYQVLPGSNNLDLEHAFMLAAFLRIESKQLLKRAEEILSGRYQELTKLSCLDFLMSISRSIDPEVFKSLNTLAFRRTKYEIIKFVSRVNLLIYSDTYDLGYIKKVLMNSTYPTLFYRLINNIDDLPVESHPAITSLIAECLNHAKFTAGVKDDLRKQLDKATLIPPDQSS